MLLANSQCSTLEKTEQKKAKAQILGSADILEEREFGMLLANSQCSTPEKTEQKKAETKILCSTDISEERGTWSISYSCT